MQATVCHQLKIRYHDTCHFGSRSFVKRVELVAKLKKHVLSYASAKASLELCGSQELDIALYSDNL